MNNNFLKNTKLLELKNISKSFPGVLAVDNVSFDIDRGEVIALVGQNGAGKSTLVNIIYGVIKSDSGEIILEGNNVTKEINSTLANNLGISVMFQESVLIPQLNIMDNIFLGNEIHKSNTNFVDSDSEYRKCKEIFKMLDHDFDLKMKVEKLSRGQKRIVELARALNKKSSLIIMDEPTAAIDMIDKEHLFNVIRNIKKMGVSVLFISHYLDEIFEIGDKIVIIRDGKKVCDLVVNKYLKVSEIVEAMTGYKEKSLNNNYKNKRIIGKETVLEVKNLTKKREFENINFYLKKGEILGISGLVDSGQKSLVNTIYGIDRYNSGEIYLNNKHINIKSSLQAIKNGIGYIPEDRLKEGFLPNMNIRENMTLAIIDKLNIGLGFINKKREISKVLEYIEKFKIITTSVENKFISLSGGNKQKAIVSRLLMANLQILIINEPTHGVDVKARVEIQEKLLEIANSGVSQLLITSELDELLNICDRILIFRDGLIIKELISKEVDEDIVLKYINGTLS